LELAETKMTKQKTHRRTSIAYSKGYKRGYVVRSDEEYNKVMFDEWHKNVAGPTEKHACFNNHARNPIPTCKT